MSKISAKAQAVKEDRVGFVLQKDEANHSLRAANPTSLQNIVTQFLTYEQVLISTLIGRNYDSWVVFFPQLLVFVVP